MKKTLLAMPISLLLSGAYWPGVTMAEEANGAKSLDRNRDGFVSIAEADANATLAKHFASLDTNGDDLLNETELAAQHVEDEHNDN